MRAQIHLWIRCLQVPPTLECRRPVAAAGRVQGALQQETGITPETFCCLLKKLLRLVGLSGVAQHLGAPAPTRDVLRKPLPECVPTLLGVIPMSPRMRRLGKSRSQTRIFGKTR